MADDRLKAIRDLERAIRVWELLRDHAQRVSDEAEDSVKSILVVAHARAYIERCNESILASKARIIEIEREG
jgi:hypothetical protein